MMKYIAIFSFTVLTLCQSCAQGTSTKKEKKTGTKMETTLPGTLDTATIGGGCFWCTEAIYQRLNGVVSVASGYSGGKIKNPTYKEVCSGLTGHAEVIQIVFDTTKISFTEILEVFMKTHDPTTLNRQGADEGTQYRSVIFYNSPEQKATAESVIKELDAAGAFNSKITTEVSPLEKFYIAEDYHQDYYNQNKNSNSYCSFVIVPKIEKFEKVFKDKLKK
jgi:peptide-methionine (S)-S-oxide reductase